MKKQNKKKGLLVRTVVSETPGIIYAPYDLSKGKSQVHLCDEDFKPTGEKKLISNKLLYAVGYID